MASYLEAQGAQVLFINTDNIDATCLNRERLHLNKKGCSKFSFNLIESMKSMRLDVVHAAQFIKTSSNVSLRKSTYETLKSLRNENPSNVIFSLLNIHFTRCKFEDLKYFFINNVDILLIGERKLYSFYADAQCFI